MAPTVSSVLLYVEAVGCPTICTHCWAQGVPYAATPPREIAWVLQQAVGFGQATGLPVSPVVSVG